MTMTVSVMRAAQDHTNGGVSSRHDRLLVISKGDRPPVSPAYPVMILEQHALGAVSLRPLNHTPQSKVEFGPMAGGNYAVGDGRFDEAVEKLLGTKFYGAVPIHDRCESEELHFNLY
jgi:hypothetical protein